MLVGPLRAASDSHRMCALRDVSVGATVEVAG